MDAPHPSAESLPTLQLSRPYYPDLSLTLLPCLVTADVLEGADEVLPRDVAVELCEAVLDVLPLEVPDEVFEPVVVLWCEAAVLLVFVLSGRGSSGKGPSMGPSGRGVSDDVCRRDLRPAAPLLFFPVCTLLTLLILPGVVLVAALVGFLPVCVLPVTISVGTGSTGTACLRVVVVALLLDVEYASSIKRAGGPGSDPVWERVVTMVFAGTMLPRVCVSSGDTDGRCENGAERAGFS